MTGLLSAATATALRALGARPTERRLGGFDLRVWEVGPADGEPWILLHGLGSTALSWRAPIARLRRDCRLWVPELSEHGGSRCPSGGLNVREGVAAVRELAAIAGGGRPVNLAGISLGAWIAVRAALALPDAWQRLVLVAAAGYREQDWERIGRLVTIETIDDVERFYRALFVRTPLVLRGARGLFRDAYSSRAVRHVLTTLGEEDAYGDAELAALRPPVGLIWGEADGLFELPVAERMAAAIPNARLTVIPGCAHGVQWERPRQLAEAVCALRESTAQPAAAPAEGQWQPRST